MHSLKKAVLFAIKLKVRNVISTTKAATSLEFSFTYHVVAAEWNFDQKAVLAEYFVLHACMSGFMRIFYGLLLHLTELQQKCAFELRAEWFCAMLPSPCPHVATKPRLLTRRVETRSITSFLVECSVADFFSWRISGLVNKQNVPKAKKLFKLSNCDVYWQRFFNDSSLMSPTPSVVWLKLYLY